MITALGLRRQHIQIRDVALVNREGAAVRQTIVFVDLAGGALRIVALERGTRG